MIGNERQINEIRKGTSASAPRSDYTSGSSDTGPALDAPFPTSYNNPKSHNKEPPKEEKSDKKLNLVVALYCSYSFLESILVALIAIEFKNIYFLSEAVAKEKGRGRDPQIEKDALDHIEVLLIAGILDILTFIALITVIAQPSSAPPRAGSDELVSPLKAHRF